MNDPDPEIAAVLTAYAAYARGDIDQAIAGLHPHVEWTEPEQFPYGGRCWTALRIPMAGGLQRYRGCR
jgi:ketosteroid isomerase-like protein